MKKILPIIIALLAMCSAGCSGSASPSDVVASDPTGAAGLTNYEVEMYFYKEVPDSSLVVSSIRDDGSYSLDFSLASDKSEWEYNYDEYALAVQNACKKFSDEYDVKAGIFSIHFFSGDDSSIYWLSLDDGKTGTLNETLAPSYKREQKMTFDELVEYYSAKK
jgi:hypothetical protein